MVNAFALARAMSSDGSSLGSRVSTAQGLFTSSLVALPAPRVEQGRRQADRERIRARTHTAMEESPTKRSREEEPV